MWRWSICVCRWGVDRQIELPCLLLYLLRWLLWVTLIWLTSPQKPLYRSISFTTVSRSPNSQPVLHQWRAATKTNIFTVLPSNPTLHRCRPLPSFSYFFPHPTPNIPISLPLNSPSVPVTLRRVWGVIPAPQFLWMAPFWMFTLCDRLLYIPTVLIRRPTERATGDTEIFHRFTNGAECLKMWRKTGLRRNATCIGQMKSIVVEIPCVQLYSCYRFLPFFLLSFY